LSIFFSLHGRRFPFYIDENQDNETLKDMSKNGKRRPWREKKIDNVSYADILEILKIKKAFNVKQCGNVLENLHCRFSSLSMGVVSRF
jgi:plasmid rolling circle replication initiator protein Rep